MNFMNTAFEGLEILAKGLEIVFLTVLVPIALIMALPFYAIGLFTRKAGV